MEKFRELIFIANPEVTQEQLADIDKEIRKIVKLKEHECWGVKKLAYPVKNYKEGNYSLYSFTSDKETSDKLEEYIKNNEIILKHIIVTHDTDPDE